MDGSESGNVELGESRDKGGKEIIEVLDYDVLKDEEGEVAMPKVGMGFNTVDEIYECYKRYSKSMGFPCKKRSSKKDNGQLRHVTFSCIREGKNKIVTDASAVLNPPIKTGCKAKLTARLEPDDKWRISVFVVEHNHQTIPIEARYWRYNKVNNNPMKRKHLLNDKQGTKMHEHHHASVNDNPEVVAEQSPPRTFSLNRCEIGEAQFYKFGNDKSHDKFQPGQVWASYCKLDGMPKYYVEITRVELSPDIKLYIKWLEPCAPPREVIKWLDEKMPVCCGTFKAGKIEMFNDTTYVSHLATGVSISEQSVYEIYPKKGEVWAMYRNFNSEWTCDDLKNCEYDVVEVLEVYDVRWLIVLVLVQVAGFETVFKAKREAGHDFIMGIPWIELFRFSHQVPAFRFTEVRYGSLRGCLELDPKSMPACLFSLK
ncbi:hypothetical protein MKW94_011576 [Papaver nudicaule]|uniref:Protein FAR1-RELATED SEQUENCE n=1 Tax=Papaver nudicaule TaxID=74823 RepID=A0AA42ARQ5_PAPNU|nr:hypothetical protein [Papaver nudicaule]MCL7044261.1 hypothetical protein [Papaver nudicaule]